MKIVCHNMFTVFWFNKQNEFEYLIQDSDPFESMLKYTVHQYELIRYPFKEEIPVNKINKYDTKLHSINQNNLVCEGFAGPLS